VVGNVAQFGFLFTGEKLSPNLAKLNPISGLKKLISLRSLVELAKSIIKLVIIRRGRIYRHPSLSGSDSRPDAIEHVAILGFIGQVILPDWVCIPAWCCF
jgi:hypothetical protein